MEDFERERRDRAEAASKHESEKAAMSLKHQAATDVLSNQMEELESQIKVKQKLMQKEQVQWEKEIQRLNHELKKFKTKSGENDALQLVHAEKQSIEDAYAQLNEAVLEEASAHTANLEKQMTKLKEDHDKSVHQLQQVSQERDRLHSECREMHQRVYEANSDLKSLAEESLAKTQQVKQYKKQVDNFRALLQESNARIEEYEAKLEQYHHDLTYYQRDIQAREEDEESKVHVTNEHCISFCVRPQYISG